jgi:hypothetical protein
MKETILSFTVLVPGFVPDLPLIVFFYLRTASVVLYLGLPPISAAIAGCSLAALY